VTRRLSPASRASAAATATAATASTTATTTAAAAAVRGSTVRAVVVIAGPGEIESADGARGPGCPHLAAPSGTRGATQTPRAVQASHLTPVIPRRVLTASRTDPATPQQEGDHGDHQNDRRREADHDSRGAHSRRLRLLAPAPDAMRAVTMDNAIPHVRDLLRVRNADLLEPDGPAAGLLENAGAVAEQQPHPRRARLCWGHRR
jgi:hypothetical protein